MPRKHRGGKKQSHGGDLVTGETPFPTMCCVASVASAASLYKPGKGQLSSLVVGVQQSLPQQGVCYTKREHQHVQHVEPKAGAVTQAYYVAFKSLQSLYFNKDHFFGNCQQ